MSCTPGKVEVVGVQEVQGTEAFVLRFLQCASASESARNRHRDHPTPRERPTTAATRETAATRRCRDDEWIGKVFFAKFDPKALTQRLFSRFPNFNFVKMASSWSHATATASTCPSERLCVS